MQELIESALQHVNIALDCLMKADQIRDRDDALLTRQMVNEAVDLQCGIETFLVRLERDEKSC